MPSCWTECQSAGIPIIKDCICNIDICCEADLVYIQISLGGDSLASVIVRLPVSVSSWWNIRVSLIIPNEREIKHFRRISITFLIWKLNNCNLYTKYREREIMCKNSSSIYEIAYHRIFNISGTLVGNKIVDHEDVIGALTVGAAPDTYLLSTGFNWLGKDNCKTSRETFSFCGLGPLISTVLY